MAHTTRSRRQRRKRTLSDPALEKERAASGLTDPSWLPPEWLSGDEALAANGTATTQHIAQHDDQTTAGGG